VASLSRTVEFGALGVIRARCFFELVARVDRAIFGVPASGAPPAVRHAMGDGKVERGPVRTGLPADTIFILAKHMPGTASSKDVKMAPRAPFVYAHPACAWPR